MMGLGHHPYAPYAPTKVRRCYCCDEVATTPKGVRIPFCDAHNVPQAGAAPAPTPPAPPPAPDPAIRYRGQCMGCGETLMGRERNDVACTPCWDQADYDACQKYRFAYQAAPVRP